MLILAVESSCDETAAAVVKDGRYLVSSVISSQIPYHKIYGGVVPEIASRKHVEVISSVTKLAIKKAKIDIKDLNALAVTYSPGLVGSLLIGINFIKGMSIASKLPIIPVNHLKAHIAANYLVFKNLKPPFLGVVVSGGHTSIFYIKSYTDYTLVGNTLDDAMGETFDKVARVLGISYPGGANLDKIAECGDDSMYNFPMPKVEGKNFNLSYSGLKTSVINLVNKMKMKGEIIKKEDIAASFRKVAVKNLVEKIIKARNKLNLHNVVIAGGAASNLLLRRELKKESLVNNFKLYIPNPNLCTDNAAMVGSQGYFEFKSGTIADLTLNTEFIVKNN